MLRLDTISLEKSGPVAGIRIWFFSLRRIFDLRRWKHECVISSERSWFDEIRSGAGVMLVRSAKAKWKARTSGDRVHTLRLWTRPDKGRS